MDFWRIFENFGFAILLHKLPTFHSFLTFLTPTCFGKSSRVRSVFKIFKNSLAYSPAKSKGLPMVSADFWSGYWSRLQVCQKMDVTFVLGRRKYGAAHVFFQFASYTDLIGSYMAFASYMDLIWRLRLIWILYGSYMHLIWILYGSYMATASYMDLISAQNIRSI